MVGSNIFSGWLAKGALTVAAGAFVASMAVPANAASLRRAAAGASSASGSAAAGVSDPGSVLYGYFDVSEESDDNGTGNGDNVMRLINTTGQDMCALVYVFDDDEELGECCGCPLTANELLSFGIGGGKLFHPDTRPASGLTDNLTANWREASHDEESGVIAVIGATATAQCTTNGSTSNGTTPNPACNAGCDPTIRFQEGVLVQCTQSGFGLNGNIVHNQRIGTASGLTEVSMFDDSPGDSLNTASNLQDQCHNAITQGSGKGWCTCPREFGDNKDR